MKKRFFGRFVSAVPDTNLPHEPLVGYRVRLHLGEPYPSARGMADGLTDADGFVELFYRQAPTLGVRRTLEFTIEDLTGRRRQGSLLCGRKGPGGHVVGRELPRQPGQQPGQHRMVSLMNPIEVAYGQYTTPVAGLDIVNAANEFHQCLVRCCHGNRRIIYQAAGRVSPAVEPISGIWPGIRASSA